MLFYIPTGEGFPGLPSWFWTVGYIAWPWMAYALFAFWFKRATEVEDKEHVLSSDHPSKGWRMPYEESSKD